MPKYVIERELLGGGELSSDEVRQISQKSCQIIGEIGSGLQWVQSYVTENKIYCVYISPSKNLIEKHAKRGGFPVTSISEVKNIIDPTSSE